MPVSEAGTDSPLHRPNSFMLENELMCEKLEDNEIQTPHVPKSIRTARTVARAVFAYLQRA